jgi:hypothetical protein
MAKGSTAAQDSQSLERVQKGGWKHVKIALSGNQTACKPGCAILLLPETDLVSVSFQRKSRNGLPPHNQPGSIVIQSRILPFERDRYFQRRFK